MTMFNRFCKDSSKCFKLMFRHYVDLFDDSEIDKQFFAEINELRQ